MFRELKDSKRFPKLENRCEQLLLSDLNRCHAKVLFHVLSEEGGVRKTESVADLLDAIVCLLEIVTDILNHVLCNPFVGCLAGILLAKSGKIFGRYAEFRSIPFHSAVFHIDRVKQVEEVLEMIAGSTSVICDLICQHPLFKHSAKPKDATAQKRLDDIGAEGVVDTFVEAKAKHLVEVCVKLQVFISHRNDVYSANINHIIPDIHLFAQAPQRCLTSSKPNCSISSRLTAVRMPTPTTRTNFWNTVRPQDNSKNGANAFSTFQKYVDLSP